ncbi:hypothetical protein [Parashewanella spongiae]|nr:hypothetical protein [Parashewanella spongiae]
MERFVEDFSEELCEHRQVLAEYIEPSKALKWRDDFQRRGLMPKECVNEILLHWANQVENSSYPLEKKGLPGLLKFFVFSNQQRLLEEFLKPAEAVPYLITYGEHSPQSFSKMISTLTAQFSSLLKENEETAEKLSKAEQMITRLETQLASKTETSHHIIASSGSFSETAGVIAPLSDKHRELLNSEVNVHVIKYVIPTIAHLWEGIAIQLDIKGSDIVSIKNEKHTDFDRMLEVLKIKINRDVFLYTNLIKAIKTTDENTTLALGVQSHVLAEQGARNYTKINDKAEPLPTIDESKQLFLKKPVNWNSRVLLFFADKAELHENWKGLALMTSSKIALSQLDSFASGGKRSRDCFSDAFSYLQNSEDLSFKKLIDVSHLLIGARFAENLRDHILNRSK